MSVSTACMRERTSICKLIWCSGLAWIYDQLMGAICHAYMCMLLYVKVVGCSGIAWIYDQLRGVHLSCIHVNASICETYLV